MKLLVRHQTTYRYEGSSTRLAMLLKLKPRSHEGQRVDWWNVSVNGVAVENFTLNGHGDYEALWICNDRIESATIVAEGLIETQDTAGIVRGLAPGPDPMVYLRETPLTHASAEMLEAAASLPQSDPLPRLHALSALVRERVPYETGATHAQTTAAESFELGAGVCQDHAHMFIAMARGMGIPVRYVSGYLLASESEGEMHETHAWAEARVPALGWIGFDISNGLCVTERYIRLACGLDAHDAAPIRGSAVAAGAIHVDADVRIDQSLSERGGAQASQAQDQRQQ